MRDIRFFHAVPILAGWLLAISPVGRAAPAIEDLHRLYDLSFVSPTNPVLAQVKAYAIEIPVSEFRGFLHYDLVYTEGKHGELSRAEKRAALDRLLDEHFLLAAAYRQKADKTPGLVDMLKSTEDMLAAEALTRQEIGTNARTAQEFQKLSAALLQRIFDQTDIHVSNEAYAKLKTAAKRVNAAGAASGKEDTHAPASGPVDGLTADDRKLPLATCKLGAVTIGDALQAYTQAPPADRPDLENQAALVELLKQILGDGLLAAEAREKGLDKSPGVREKLQLNRNVLMRLWYLDQLADQAAAEMKKPGTEDRLKQWYAANLKSRYTDKDENGKEQVMSFADNHDEIQNDYFEDLQAKIRADAVQQMRKGAKIWVNEKLLDPLVITWPVPPPADPAPAAPPASPISTGGPDAVKTGAP